MKQINNRIKSSTKKHIIQLPTDSCTFVSVIKPDAVNGRASVTVEKERILKLELQAAVDRLDEVVQVQPIYDHEPVEGMRRSGVHEKCTLHVGFLPLVARVVIRIDCDLKIYKKYSH